MRVNDLAPNPKNPRKITPKKLTVLAKALREFGDLSGFVYNIRTQRLVCGHQRASVLKDTTAIVKEVVLGKAGTVAEGYVEFEGERFAYREVDWDENREKAANIAANKGAGEWDMDGLKEWMLDLDAAGFDMDLTMFDEKERDPFFKVDKSESDGDKYTKKIAAPIYEPTGPCPDIRDLVDAKKVLELVKNIQATDISLAEKLFLIQAASRHAVFSYDKIAEYYAHASVPVQQLMEESALVIIDYDKAIENGFVSLSEKLASIYE